MHVPTGDIYTAEEMALLRKNQKLALDESEFVPLRKDEYDELKPMNRRSRKNKMRNKPCLCGSGVKFKRCCWSKYE